MNIISLKSANIGRTIIIDALLLGTVCLIPAVSHLIAFPLYRLNPMLFCLLAGMILVRDRRNAYLLAILLPLVAMLVSGMPTPLKAFCMMAELVTVVGVYHLVSRKFSVFPSLFSAIIVAKGVYYALKTIVVAPVVLISTPLWIQILVALIASLLFAYFNTKQSTIN